MRRFAGVLALYLLLSVLYTWPLAVNLHSGIPSDPADPVLNTAILWWNATTIPFSAAWWNAPHYYPADGVSAFTESLVGISPIFSPVYWLTRDPIVAYNVTYFLTWPLSAFAVFLLVNSLTRQRSAAFLAGLAYAFTPYRTTEIAHIQSLSSFYLPLVLLGLHGFLNDRRPAWLWLFAASWLLQSLANGYYMFYGAVLIALWLVYFCSTRRAWRAGATIAIVWALASLPLAPIMYKYSVVHEHFGLVRSLNEVLAYSAAPRSWAEVSGDIWFWRSLLPQGKDDLFPGATAVALVGLASLLLLRRDPPHQRTSMLRTALALATAVSLVFIVVTLIIGPWTANIAGIPVRMKDLNRAVLVTLVCGLSLVALTPRMSAALVRRSPFVFYLAATGVIALLCCGPVLRTGDNILVAHAPYGWLMALPGFDELRVPPRFWMLGILSLSVAAGLGFSHIRPQRATLTAIAFSVIAAGLLIDGWMPTMRIARPPVLWPDVEPPGRPEPILEVPLGPDWDWDATFRAVAHRRRVVNGVSGYDPPHYNALRTGLDDRDPAMLAALASLGPIDIVVNGAADPDGTWMRYVSSAPGAIGMAGDGARTVYRIPRGTPEPALGHVIPIAHAEGFRHDELFANTSKEAADVFDGKMETAWEDYPQQAGQWIVVDLGGIHEISGLTHTIADHFLDFPRRLAIEVSRDGSTWERVWEGSGAAPAFLSLVRGPREGAMRFAFGARPARYVRLLQLDNAARAWHVSELQVHAPMGR